MASLTDLENQLAAAQASLQGYQDPNLQSTINNQIQAAYSPSLQSATQNVGKMMQDFLPNYFNVPFTGNIGGTSAADLTPQQKMQAMGTRLGEMGGQLTAGANYADLLGGRLADAQNRALQALQFGYGAAQGNYGNIFNQLQAARDEAARQAALALQRKQLQIQQQGIIDQQKLWDDLKNKLAGDNTPEALNPDRTINGIEYSPDAYNYMKNYSSLPGFKTAATQTPLQYMSGAAGNSISKLPNTQPFNPNPASGLTGLVSGLLSSLGIR